MKKTLVTNNNLSQAYDSLIGKDKLGLDTETYGVKIYDKMFALQIASEEETFYFNFHNYKDGTFLWERKELLDALAKLFNKNSLTWFAHSAKFDLHRLANERTFLSGRVHCTQSIENILYNQHLKYSLDACLKRRGRAKNSKVEDYIKEHHLWEWESVEGKKKRNKNKFYWKVPFDIMFEYGCDDAYEALFLGNDQLEDMYSTSLYNQECALTKTLLSMEREGVKYDKEYTKKAKKYEEGCLEDAISEATELSGEEFRNGPTWLRSAFDRHGQSYQLHPKTRNPIFDRHALAKMESPIANVVKEIRTREKYIGTYYSSFNYYADQSGIIHANIRQSGTDTGRLSYSDPNLQNVPKEEDFAKGDIQVRKCLVPRKDYCFVMIDFDQQEFRLMLDYAGEHELINRIMTEGLCVHQATADMMGVKRKPAKTLNFGLLYGMGVEKLAKALGISVPEAKALRALYFSRLPKVKGLIRDVISTAETRGFVRTFSNRKLYFPDKNFAYKAPNHLIQGGCGDIARKAMNKLGEHLAPFESKMLIQVHDEIVFEVHKDELELVPELKTIMESIYRPMNGMKLTCGVEHSWVSWGKQDIIDGPPRI